ncbi:ATP-dependent helicase HrpB [Beijerinckia indica]|uniref:ATP-dependent helicase HrpB n=1 Tax=Beijerinckia indica subsp. indica (strain ATCC 9039 / DSM 1715 / NCIMB 8712) TaxID=395963 RepID=B2IJN0_BEII9|nr:ATP-dependent helicase HrpB [Beijerinckia indica]ACB94902.1 ATP-dependent helicase HrpB [Beijerinckia indica subsp. indica ATCC 9039]
MTRSFPPLPIEAVLEDITAHLKHSRNAVLVAPPGAGKTTLVPLALLDAPFSAHKKIILIEPRRLAARAATNRMASLLGEAVGERIGLRMRSQTRISEATRIEVVTEGVFSRMILADPGLTGVAAVIFDEFHERSLDADLGLALAIEAQSALCEDLRLLVMSATLDGARVSALLGESKIIESEGRVFPITTHYLGRDPAQRIEDAMARAILRALAEEKGSILAFLPGQAEITRVKERLGEIITDPAIDIIPLYAAADRASQEEAITPAPLSHRKIVLATSIAETSLTIEGIRVVIDSGLARVPCFEPGLGLTRLETRRASRAAADQRRGRAGRLEPGVCYRLWEEAATGALPAFTTPEILAADLSGLVLDLAAWGEREPANLAWLDPPPKPAVQEARALLREIGALDRENGLTERGQAISKLALPPRLAAMIVAAAEKGEAQSAAEIAVLLVERNLGGTSPDLGLRLQNFRRDRSPRAEEARKLAALFLRQIQAIMPAQTKAAEASPARLLALAYPDRLAKRRDKTGVFLMANGRAAELDPTGPLAQSPYLAIGELTGQAARQRILLAAALDEGDLEILFRERIETIEETVFEPSRAALQTRSRRRFGRLVLSERNLPVSPTPANAALLAQNLAALGLARLPWTKAITQWRDRVLFLRQNEGDEDWPDVSDVALSQTSEDWLAPFLIGKTALAEIGPDDLEAALKNLLTFAQQRRLEVEAPTHVTTPAGSRIALEYTESRPVLAARVQEFYGLAHHPTLAGGKVPITLHLLSPASRPIQITMDLPGFWKGSWASVKSEMKGRYPRHPWPDDPANAMPTTRAKPRPS